MPTTTSAGGSMASSAVAITRFHSFAASPPEIIQRAVSEDPDLADNDDVQQILEWAADNRGAATTLVMQLIPLLQP